MVGVDHVTEKQVEAVVCRIALAAHRPQSPFPDRRGRVTGPLEQRGDGGLAGSRRILSPTHDLESELRRARRDHLPQFRVGAPSPLRLVRMTIAAKADNIAGIAFLLR